MLNIGGLKDGIVLDHIEAGRSLDIYYHLGLDKLECQVAIIKNAKSNKMGAGNNQAPSPSAAPRPRLYQGH